MSFSPLLIPLPSVKTDDKCISLQCPFGSVLEIPLNPTHYETHKTWIGQVRDDLQQLHERLSQKLQKGQTLEGRRKAIRDEILLKYFGVTELHKLNVEAMKTLYREKKELERDIYGHLWFWVRILTNSIDYLSIAKNDEFFYTHFRIGPTAYAAFLCGSFGPKDKTYDFYPDGQVFKHLTRQFTTWCDTSSKGSFSDYNHVCRLATALARWWLEPRDASQTAKEILSSLDEIYHCFDSTHPPPLISALLRRMTSLENMYFQGDEDTTYEDDFYDLFLLGLGNHIEGEIWHQNAVGLWQGDVPRIDLETEGKEMNAKRAMDLALSIIWLCGERQMPIRLLSDVYLVHIADHPILSRGIQYLTLSEYKHHFKFDEDDVDRERKFQMSLKYHRESSGQTGFLSICCLEKTALQLCPTLFHGITACAIREMDENVQLPASLMPDICRLSLSCQYLCSVIHMHHYKQLSHLTLRSSHSDQAAVPCDLHLNALRYLKLTGVYDFDNDSVRGSYLGLHRVFAPNLETLVIITGNYSSLTLGEIRRFPKLQTLDLDFMGEQYDLREEEGMRLPDSWLLDRIISTYQIPIHTFYMKSFIWAGRPLKSIISESSLQDVANASPNLVVVRSILRRSYHAYTVQTRMTSKESPVPAAAISIMICFLRANSANPLKNCMGVLLQYILMAGFPSTLVQNRYYTKDNNYHEREHFRTACTLRARMRGHDNLKRNCKKAPAILQEWLYVKSYPRINPYTLDRHFSNLCRHIGPVLLTATYVLSRLPIPPRKLARYRKRKH